MAKAVPLIYLVIPRMVDFGGCVINFRALESVAVLELNVVFREAYDTGVLQVQYLSIDIHSLLFHVKFEDSLSISVSRNRATRHKN
jgi:hypothetical protein